MCLFRALYVIPLIVTVLSAQGIINGDFESGRNNGWLEYSSGGYTLIGTGDFFASSSIDPPVFPRSGNYMARIGGYNYEVNAISQTVTLPNTTPLYLKLYVQDRNSTTSECSGLWVGARIRASIAGQILYDSYLCYYNQLQDWTAFYFDLTAVAGQTIQIIFQADAASSVWSYLYIDDVSLTNTTDVETEISSLPKDFELKQNYPNPFNPTTVISYQLPVISNVSLKVYDLLGKEVATLVNAEQPAGSYEVNFDASQLASGVYFYRLSTGTYSSVKKLLLLR